MSWCFFGRFLSYFPRTKLRWFGRKNVWKMMSANLQQHLTLVFRIDFMATGIFLKEEFSRKRKHNRVKIYLYKHCYFIHFVFPRNFLFHFQDLWICFIEILWKGFGMKTRMHNQKIFYSIMVGRWSLLNSRKKVNLFSRKSIMWHLSCFNMVGNKIRLVFRSLYYNAYLVSSS